MAHRGPMREVFGILCMAVLIRKSEKKASPPASTLHLETVAAVDDYFYAHNTTVICPTSTPPPGYLPTSSPPSGYLTSILSFLMLALSLVGNELLDWIFQLALHYVLLPSLRIARRWSAEIVTSLWRRICGWGSRGRITGGDATSDMCPPTDNKMNEPSQSESSHVATVIRQKRALAASQAHQENTQLRQKAIENTKLSTANKRLKRRVLSLKMGQQSLVTEARNSEQAAARKREQKLAEEKDAAASKREQKLVEERDAAAREREQRLVSEKDTAARKREQRLIKERDAAKHIASDAISKATYDSLRNSFDTLRDQLKEAREGRVAAVDELRAERAKMETVVQQESEKTTTQSTVPSDDRTRDDAVQAAEDRAQEAETRAEESQAKAKEAESKFQDAQTSLQEAEAKAEEAKAKAEEAEAKVEEAETKVQNANVRAQDAELKAQNAEDSESTLQKELKDRNRELEQKLQRAEEAHELAGSKPEGPSHEEIYGQGFQAAVRKCEAKAQEVVDREVDDALARRNAEVLAHFNTEVENAVDREKASFQAALDTANERATTAESRAADNANAALTEALQRATTAEARATSADVTLAESQRSNDTIKQKASDEWERAEKFYKISCDEYHRAEKAEDEVRRFRSGKASQDQRIQRYLDDISRLKKLVPTNASLANLELESKTRDRQRAQALLMESAVRSYDWATKQVLKQLLEANEKIIELECILKNPETQSNQTDFLKVLRNVEVDRRDYMRLNLPMRQVLVKQCRAVNVRLNDLRTAIQSSERPRKEGLLYVMYQARGDEEAFYDEDDSEPEPSSDEDEDEDAADSGGQRDAPRRLNQPTSRRARSAAAPPETPLPVDARAQNERKRKGNPNDDSDAASWVETRQMAGPSHGVPNLDPQLAATPAQHPAIQTPFATSSDPEQALQAKPTKIPGPRQRPHLTASERQQRLRYVQNPESEATRAQESAAPTSTSDPTSFSFHMPKNIASGIRPHVRKYTRLSGMTNMCIAAANPPPANPNPNPIFKGLSLLGPAMAAKKNFMPDKKAALPGLPPPDENDVLLFESSAVAQDPAPRREVEDRHQAHTASDDDDEEDGKLSETFYPNDSPLTGILRRNSMGRHALLIRQR